MKDSLRPELPGIVRWLVDASLEWQREGLGQPAEVTVATEHYREASDVLGEFLAECCTLSKSSTAKASDVRGAYETWCKTSGEKPVSGRRFGQYLVQRGIEKRLSNGTWYSGLRSRNEF